MILVSLLRLSNPLWRNSTLKQILKSGVSDVKPPPIVSELYACLALGFFSRLRLDQFLVDGQTLQEQDVVDEEEQLLFEKKLFGMENTDMSDPVVLHYSYVQVSEILKFEFKQKNFNSLTRRVGQKQNYYW